MKNLKNEERTLQELCHNEAFIYAITTDYAAEISEKLNIERPDLEFYHHIENEHPITHEISYLGGKLVTPEDHTELKNNIVILSIAPDEDTQDNLEDYILRMLGTLAHECRHIWQKKYAPDLACSSAIGFTESLTDPAEIDADAFAILCLSQINDIAIARAGRLVCPEEKEKHIEEYRQRIQKMEELKAELFPDPPQKKSFLKTVFGFFGGKKNDESN